MRPEAELSLRDGSVLCFSALAEFLEMRQQYAGRRRQLGRLANADMQSPERPQIRQPRNPDRGVLAAPFGCCRRNDSDPNAGGDHSAYSIEACEAHAKLDRPSCPDGVLAQMQLKGVRRRQADEFLVEQGSKGYMAMTAKGMISRRDKDELVDRERESLKVSEIDDIGDDADLDKALRH